MLAVEGVLKGYDQMLNLVLDDATEYLRGARRRTAETTTRRTAKYSSNLTTPLDGLPRADPDDPMTLTDKKRRVGLTVCRGTAVTFVCPQDGMREIANPFVPAEGTS
mmetsp:Transcript_1891/g.11434  ORF Transcript_1891/g.11434 Transcript_1891/m.11434 type:complete len:107 (-) Transcript_1891:3432-3752(-)